MITNIQTILIKGKIMASLHRLLFGSNKSSPNESKRLPTPIKNTDYEGRTVEVIGDQKFVNCQFGNLKSEDSLSLVECQAEKVNAKGNILLQNCSITGPVTASKKIVAVNCGNIDSFSADETHVHPSVNSKKLTINSEGKTDIHLTWSGIEAAKVLKKGITYVLDAHTSFKRDFILDEYIHTVRIKGSIEGDVIFPEDSLFPERRVILEEGGSLLGSVKNGKLIKKNMPINSGIDLDKYVESVCIKGSVAEK